MSCLRWILAPIAPLYWLIVCVRNWAFDRHYKHIAEVPIPVISVGNLTAGGTGKTPITIYLADAIGKMGLHTNIVSRGYGGRQEFGPMVVDPSSSPTQSGDEPLMMARRLGPNRITVGRKRYHAAILALSLRPRPDMLIMDDGFQHRGLKRDVDILLLDGIRCWGNGLMLPIGNLREPMHGAARASCLVVTRSNQANRDKIITWWKHWGSDGPIFWVSFAIRSIYKFGSTEKIEIDKCSTTLGSLFAFCAIGHPEAFFSDLKALGVVLIGTKSFKDHKFLSESTIQQLQVMAVNVGASGLVCTEKDAVKLTYNRSLTIPIWIAEQQVVGGEPMLSWLLQQIVTTPIRQDKAY